ncbi:Isopenicillin N synthase-like, Fe(2+) 2OG dioxygenase domain [Dillenia turbinata]|uniref:gibberellin 2beta-dioxygenase n=1 Tax=Dillenia turbinata TaxID=194707 RepID=A0AAN8V9Z4_9MAGN
MVVASPSPIKREKLQSSIELPIIDLSMERSEVSRLIVKACEDYGFFKLINHGVPHDIIDALEEESFRFFGKSAAEKLKAGPASPFGYGSKNIGFNGDVGEVEYLLFNTNPLSISQRSKFISNDPSKFSNAVKGYIEAVREVGCEILDLMAEGMWVPDTSVFSRLIRDVDNDSIFRLNHYPALPLNLNLNLKDRDTSPSSALGPHHLSQRIGFGEHSDPQILTILRSNDVAGLQISLQDGLWVPVIPDPASLCVNVGDVLQAMTNGRFVSVRHRAMVNSRKPRLSMAYFGAPPLHACISPQPELFTPHLPSLYRSFTWAEYKKAAYSLRLGETRLDLFRK